MSPSITFLPLPQTPSRPLLQRKDRTNRRSIQLSSSVPTTSTTTQILSAPAASLQDTATVSSTTTTRRSRTRNRHRSSVHLDVPAIQDRNSSLYSPASIVHDWSKSCSDLSQYHYSDLPHLGGSTTTPTGISGTNHTSCCLALNQRLSLYHSRLRTAGGNDSEETIYGPECYQATAKHSPSTDYCNGAGKDADCIYSVANNDANPTYPYPHSFTDYSTFLDADDPHTYRHCNKPPPRSPLKQAKWTDLKKKLRGVKTITMSSSTTPTPSIPPRSALRGSPRCRPSTFRPELTERDSSLYVLEVGAPLALTPSLSSGSESDLADDATARIPPSMARRSVCPETGKEKDYGVFGKKRIVSERDPLRVRDGLGPKESPSGVYTPPTFPGACGPRPSHFPTHVYTPTNFQLYPTPASSAVTRSASSSSSEGDLPQTPISPTLRVFGNKTMAGLRRISGSLASFDPRSSGSGSSTPTPASSRDSYFSYSTTSSRQSSWGPITPNSGHFPAGLGVGLTEKEGVTAPGVGPLPSPPIEGSLVPAPKRPVEEPKIKRKPVPEVIDLDEDCDVLADGLKRASFAHAL